jgi:hypothetical protein
MRNTTTTVSVEQIKNLKAIETDAAPAWEAQGGVLRTKTVDSSETSLLNSEPKRKRTSSSLVKRMPRKRRKE